MIHIGAGYYLLKTVWKKATEIKDVALHMQYFAVVAFHAAGDSIGNCTVSGNAPPRLGDGPVKKKYPADMLIIITGQLKKFVLMQ